MKFTSFIPLALALGAVAEPTKVQNKASFVERDLATVTGVLATVNQAVGELSTAVQSFNGGDASGILSASAKVQSAITDGTQKVSSGSSLTLTDALGVQAPVQDLTTKTQAVVKNLKDKKSAIVAAGQGPTTLKTLQDQKTAADALAKAISAKVPPEVGPLATQLSAGISAALQDGITAFQDVGSAPAGGSSAVGGSARPSAASSAGSSRASSAPSSAPSVGTPASSGAATTTPPARPSTRPSVSASAPAQFTGAASGNAINSFGAIAAMAAVLAF